MRVRLEGLAKAHAGTPVVSGLDLEIASGEFLVLLGASGSGKTTTLRLVAGLDAPDGGRILFDGQVIADPAAGRIVPPEQRALGMVFQSYALWPHLSVAENCALGLRARGMAADAVRARVAEALDMTGMAAFATRRPGQLSGGQQQRVAIARALAQQPRLLLFDEPLSNLDARLREQMRQEIGALTRRLGMSVIYVTHDQQEAMALADRIGLMHRGRLIACAPPAEIYHRPTSIVAAEFLGQANLIPARISGDRAVAGQLSAPCHGAQAAAAAIMLRPERLRLVPPATPASDGALVLQGVVQNRQLLGAVTEWNVALTEPEARLRVTALSTGEPGPAHGEAVGVWIAADAAHAIAADAADQA
jgi:ABC-type Fe3+/spermidine/putrescine transport system ATPase subunit